MSDKIMPIYMFIFENDKSGEKACAENFLSVGAYFHYKRRKQLTNRGFLLIIVFVEKLKRTFSSVGRATDS